MCIETGIYGYIVYGAQHLGRWGSTFIQEKKNRALKNIAITNKSKSYKNCRVLIGRT